MCIDCASSSSLSHSLLWMDVCCDDGGDDDVDDDADDAVIDVMTLMLVLISDADGVADHLSIRRRYPYR